MIFWKLNELRTMIRQRSDESNNPCRDRYSHFMRLARTLYSKANKDCGKTCPVSDCLIRLVRYMGSVRSVSVYGFPEFAAVQFRCKTVSLTQYCYSSFILQHATFDGAGLFPS